MDVDRRVVDYLNELLGDNAGLVEIQDPIAELIASHRRLREPQTSRRSWFARQLDRLRLSRS